MLLDTVNTQVGSLPSNQVVYTYAARYNTSALASQKPCCLPHSIIFTVCLGTCAQIHPTICMLSAEWNSSKP